SRNEYIKIAVLLMFVMFILSAVLGRKATVIIGVIALIFTCLGAAFYPIVAKAGGLQSQGV
ncbi:MAG: hypothetical protein JRH03_16740, partial [Deltaproteobacteria bacterium]|nr:hypothetical protein [Deltaproteobacteria bacterium]